MSAVDESEKIAWVSRAMMEAAKIKGFDSDVFEEDEERALDAMGRNEYEAEPLPRDRFPRAMYESRIQKPMKRLPHLAKCGGFWTVSAACAEVLRQFDLGDGALYPVEMYHIDRKTRIEGDYFCLNFGAQKTALVPERSRVTKPPGRPGVWKLHLHVQQDDLTLLPSALKGPDLWFDPSLARAFFVSDRLKRALADARLARDFRLFRCRIARLN